MPFLCWVLTPMACFPRVNTPHPMGLWVPFPSHFMLWTSILTLSTLEHLYQARPTQGYPSHTNLISPCKVMLSPCWSLTSYNWPACCEDDSLVAFNDCRAKLFRKGKRVVINLQILCHTSSAIHHQSLSQAAHTGLCMPVYNRSIPWISPLIKSLEEHPVL